jgi:hypothetical protein
MNHAPNRFHDQALAALDSRSGKWHCVSCWAQAAGLTAPEDQQRLTALARSFLTSSDPEAKRGGTCDAGRHQTGGLLVRAAGRRPAAARR